VSLKRGPQQPIFDDVPRAVFKLVIYKFSVHEPRHIWWGTTCNYVCGWDVRQSESDKRRKFSLTRKLFLPASLSVKKGSIADDPFNLLFVVSSIGKSSEEMKIYPSR
jgi:hypothetical protein